MEGRGVDRHLERVQEITEREGAALRRLIQDYGGVLDSRTMFYYRARRDIMESSSFWDQCLRFAREEARSLVDRYIPEQLVVDYGLNFDRMAALHGNRLLEDLGIANPWRIGTGPSFPLPVFAAFKAP